VVKKIFRTIWLWIKNGVIIFLLSSLIITLAYRVIPIKLTPLMVLRQKMPKQEWKNIREISPNVYYSAMASEDPNFLYHSGFDFNAIKKAYEDSKKYNRRLRGGSGISQQCAKNIFLLPVRSWIRKGLEVYFTVMIEVFWNKKRIMEVYLNIIEMGDGIYGIEAASNAYYNKHAAQLSLPEAAMIVSCFPNPRKFTPLRHPEWINGKQTLVMTYAGWMPRVKWGEKNKP
jgi:monofunctional biosynthetic peptidoglycan transglycosylase